MTNLKLKSILEESLIDLNLSATNKKEVICELSMLLFKNGYISDYNQLIKDIYIREEEGITGIGNNVAIPHAKSTSVKKVCVAIGKTEHFIEWESYDNEPVSLFFLLATPNNKEGSNEHLKLLSQIASKLADDDLLNKIKKVIMKLN